MRYLFLVLFAFSLSVQGQIPNGYYDIATGSDFTLKSQLHDIIDNHSNQGYGALWDFYSSYELDVYYENDGTILDIYSENPSGTDPYNFTKISDQCGNYSGEGDCYNREHSFPRSWFGGDVEPMNSDVHHIFASDGRVNSIRGSYPYGEVASASTTSQNGSKLGSGTSAQGYTGTVFEPIDEFKGDIARAHFYMAARYEDVIAGWENNSSSSDVVLNGTSTQVFEDWVVELMLNWHSNDPVSQKEIDRNDNAYYNHQGNRNPFIDHPEWVDEIWGDGGAEPTIDDISAVRSGTNGQNYTIEGIVTTPDYGSSSGQYFVQDNTGGINIYHQNNNGLVEEGDEVRISGSRAEFNSIIEIEPTSVTVLSSGNALPASVTLSEGDLVLNSTNDGRRVSIQGVTLDDPSQWPTSGSGSGANVDVTVGSTSFILRIDDASFYYGTAAPTGSLSITGILTRYNNDLQIMPFVDGDIQEEANLNPEIILSVSSIGFDETGVGEESAPESLTINASDLSESLTVSVSGDFKISTQANSGFTSSVNVSPTNGSITNEAVYVLFQPQTTGDRTGILTVSSSGESETVNLTGVGTAEVLSLEKSENKIYPNPASGILRLGSLPHEIPVRVLDVSGRNMNIKRVGNELDLTNLVSGQYILIVDSNPPQVFKFLVR